MAVDAIHRELACDWFADQIDARTRLIQIVNEKMFRVDAYLSRIFRDVRVRVLYVTSDKVIPTRNIRHETFFPPGFFTGHVEERNMKAL